MAGLFAWDYHGAPFKLFGTAHLAGLLVLLGCNLVLVRFRGTSPRTRAHFRLALALVLWLNEIAWHAWMWANGAWTVQSMLPLQVCSLMVWLSGLMLVKCSYRIYEFAYFWGIGGGMQALATPDLGIYGFPHYRFFQTFLSHGLILTAAVYMTVAEGYRPTWRTMLKAAVGLNIYALGIFFVNLALGSNYLMVNHKPFTASLLDLLPSWPWYLAWMELIGIVTFVLLYSPFLLRGSPPDTQVPN